MDEPTLPGADADLRAQPGAPEPEDDLDEVEHQGRVYRLPRALSETLSLGADHAARTKELEQHRAAVAERAETLEATLETRARMHAAETQLAAYQGVDWEALSREAPARAQTLWSEFQALAHAHERLGWALERRQDQARVQAEQDLARRLTETGRTLAREIEGWSPEVASRLVDYAAAFGVSLDELREIADPRLWRILHRAHEGETALKAQAQARQAAEAKDLRPAVTFSGQAPPPGTVRDDLATADWMRRRTEQTRRAR